MHHRRSPVLFFSILALAVMAAVTTSAPVAARPIPDRLNDEEFWKMTVDFSETNGQFRSDNLISNEMYYQWSLADLTSRAKAGRVYLGVGPEQNFTYIAALKPKLAIIFDIRRGNLQLHLMYKALFELSQDRAEFVGRLFSRKRPEGLTAQSSVIDIFAAYQRVQPSAAVYEENWKAMTELLSKKHGFPLSAEDIAGIEYVYDSFYRFGPNINYNSSGGNGGGGFGRGGIGGTYEELMIATDRSGNLRSYLSSEETFAVMKDLESRNLLVPVVGNFGGPKAIRAVGTYLKSIDATVSAFYLSNVEQYLQQDGIMTNFCASSATLPLDDSSTFIRSRRGGAYGPGSQGLDIDLGNMPADVKTCRY